MKGPMTIIGMQIKSEYELFSFGKISPEDDCLSLEGIIVVKKLQFIDRFVRRFSSARGISRVFAEAYSLAPMSKCIVAKSHILP